MTRYSFSAKRLYKMVLVLSMVLFFQTCTSCLKFLDIQKNKNIYLVCSPGFGETRTLASEWNKKFTADLMKNPQVRSVATTANDPYRNNEQSIDLQAKNLLSIIKAFSEQDKKEKQERILFLFGSGLGGVVQLLTYASMDEELKKSVKGIVCRGSFLDGIEVNPDAVAEVENTVQKTIPGFSFKKDIIKPLVSDRLFESLKPSSEVYEKIREACKDVPLLCLSGDWDNQPLSECPIFDAVRSNPNFEIIKNAVIDANVIGPTTDGLASRSTQEGTLIVNERKVVKHFPGEHSRTPFVGSKQYDAALEFIVANL